MAITWCLPQAKQDELLAWASMPIEVWNTLCIAHRIAVHVQYLNEGSKDENHRMLEKDQLLNTHIYRQQETQS